MAKAVDIGTSFIVGAWINEGGNVVFKKERDAFFSMPNEDLTEDMLERAGASFLRKGDRIYVIGDDALKYSIFTANAKDYRRPMAKGVLNPGDEEAIGMVELLIEEIIGKSSYPGEVIAATIPANPIEDTFDTTFHRIVMERCLKHLGYEVRIINEALCIIYYMQPKATAPDGKEKLYTGIGISFGAGMTNLVVALQAKKTFEISVGRGGDWIDQSVARVRNQQVTIVTNAKEKRLNLQSIYKSDGVLAALEIYYEELIRYTLENFARYFKESKTTIDFPLEIVIGGGTAMVPGFLQKFEACLAICDLGIPIKGIRLADNMLYAVAAGALTASISFENALKSKQPLPPTPPVVSINPPKNPHHPIIK